MVAQTSPTVGELIKFLRERKNLSARNLSLSSGLSPSYISKLESGEIQPSLKAFSDICRIVEASDKEILFLVRFL